jgi:hypothetical protein
MICNEKQKFKLSEVAPQYREMVIEVLKAGIMWKDLLDDYERRFMGDFCMRYAQYGDSTTVVGDQWKIFSRIATKLNLPCQLHAQSASFTHES